MAKQGSDIVISSECKANEVQQMHTSDNKEVNKITWPGRYSMRKSIPDRATGNPTSKPLCTGCGFKDAHPKDSFCPAKGKNCLRCGGINHFVRMSLHTVCPGKKDYRTSKNRRGRTRA